MVKKLEDSSSSSSEDDLIRSQLKECVAGFELQKKDVSKEVARKSIQMSQISKRPDRCVAVVEEENGDDDKNTHVTPEFQELVLTSL